MAQSPPPSSVPQLPFRSHQVLQQATNPHNGSIFLAPSPMERVLFNLHYQVCTVALRRTSHRCRSLVEHVLLVFALFWFGALLITHLTFVHRGSSLAMIHPEHQQAVKFSRAPELNLTAIRDAMAIPVQCLSGISGFTLDADITHVVLSTKDSNATRSRVLVVSNYSAVEGHPNSCPKSDGPRHAIASQEIRLSYSTVKGYLFLSPATSAKHNVSVQYIHVDPTDLHCFGEPFLQKLVFHLTGPDTVILNWFLATWHHTGFVYNPRTGSLLDLKHQNYNRGNDMNLLMFLKKERDKERSRLYYWRRFQWCFSQFAFKASVVAKTAIVYYITTNLVSFTLRETQGRMLDFTHQLIGYVRHDRPVAQLVFKHCLEILVFVPIMVGMIFFLIEFYRGDKFLAFMVLSIVWIAEAFSVISLRSCQGSHFFPRIFFLLFAMFHFYLYSFPFGFSYTALASTACFMLHSMFFFWHRYELPAVALGHVTADHPHGHPPSTAAMAPRTHHAQQQHQHDPRPGAPTTTIPAVALAPRYSLPIRREHSSTTSSLGRISRQTSSIGLFNTADDEDGSYMLFLDGEVVMHRGERSSAGGSLAGSHNGSLHGGSHPMSMDDNSSNNDDLNHTGRRTTRTGGGGVPSRISALVDEAPLPASTIDTLDDTSSASSSRCSQMHSLARQGRRQQDPPETSALAAILDVRRTPRTGNLSLAEQQEQGGRHHHPEEVVIGGSDPRVQSAPSFPALAGNGCP